MWNIKITTHAYLWNNELSSEETDGRQNTIYEKWDWSEWINGGVDVSESFQELKASTIAVPYGAMTAEKNFHRTKRPPKHLVQTIWKIDGSRSLEGWSLRHAVNWPPTSSMHLESSENIFCHRTVDPPNLKFRRTSVQLIKNWLTCANFKYFQQITKSVETINSLRT